jgi:hypothetical protein
MLLSVSRSLFPHTQLHTHTHSSCLPVFPVSLSRMCASLFSLCVQVGLHRLLPCIDGVVISCVCSNGNCEHSGKYAPSLSVYLFRVAPGLPARVLFILASFSPSSLYPSICGWSGWCETVCPLLLVPWQLVSVIEGRAGTNWGHRVL